MQPFRIHTGRAVPLRRSNVDTDQIIPAVYLKRITRTGFEDGLFSAWRSDPEFVLNRPEYRNASILVAGPDFGTGSSREHAVWALWDYGFRVVISSRFGDIFRGNSLKAGLLTITLEEAEIEQLWDAIEGDPNLEISVDLEEQMVRCGATAFAFGIDSYARWRLLEGLDEIGLTLRHVDQIAAFERSRPIFKPKTLNHNL